MKHFKSALLIICTLLSVEIAYLIFRPIDSNAVNISGQSDAVIVSTEVPQDDDLTRDQSTVATEAVVDTEGGMGYMIDAPGELPYKEYSWSDTLSHLYSNTPDNYDDEDLREIAKQYYDQGYYLYDNEYQFQSCGWGQGFGDHVFCSGFTVLDKNLGEGMFSIASVMKATEAEFDAYLEEFNPEIIEQKEEDGVITITDPAYTITYDRNKQIIVMTLNPDAAAVG